MAYALRTLFFLCGMICLQVITLKTASPCTLWSVSGSAAEGGGTIIAKNRDTNPKSLTTMKFYNERGGYRFLTMYGNDVDTGIKGGINEKGLAVFSATASTLTDEERAEGRKGFISNALRKCADVGCVLAMKERIAETFPNYYILGDSNGSALIEIGPEGAFSVREVKNGVLYHTNHYIDPELAEFNVKESKSSLVRYERMEKLLKSKAVFSVADFKSISADRNDGVNNSIRRNASKTKTVAAWIVGLKKGSPPVLYAYFANYGKEEKERELILNREFWDNPPVKADDN